MSDLKDIEDRIQAAYPALGPQLRRAARFLLSNPSDVALYPLRQVAEKAEVAPTTFVRLAEQIGFAGYKSLRDALRAVMRSGSGRYAADVGELLANDAGFNRLHHETADTLIRNIGTAFAAIPAKRIEAVAGLLAGARRIYVMGLRGNYSAAFYFHYVGRIFIDNLYLLDDRLGMLIDDLGGIGPRDALLAISFEPYALEAVKATQHGAAAGAAVVAITDTAVSPIAEIAREVLLVPTGSTSFYQSLIPTISILESLLCCLAAKGGEETRERVRAEFDRRERFGVYWRDPRGD